MNTFVHEVTETGAQDLVHLNTNTDVWAEKNYINLNNFMILYFI